MIPNPIDIGLPKIGKEILRKLSSKEIMAKEFDIECASWLMFYLNELEFKLPPVRPTELEEYYQRKKTDPNYQLNQKFWEDPVIRRYVQEESATFAQNHSNWWWLLFLKRNMPQEDNVNQSRIKQVMETYEKRHERVAYPQVRQDMF